MVGERMKLNEMIKDMTKPTPSQMRKERKRLKDIEIGRRNSSRVGRKGCYGQSKGQKNYKRVLNEISH